MSSDAKALVFRSCPFDPVNSGLMHRASAVRGLLVLFSE